jgi:hypothetical protein
MAMTVAQYMPLAGRDRSQGDKADAKGRNQDGQGHTEVIQS